jgi:hypothetical protein
MKTSTNKSALNATKTTVKSVEPTAKIIAFLKAGNTRGATKKKFGVSIARITALRKQAKIETNGSDASML